MSYALIEFDINMVTPAFFEGVFFLKDCSPTFDFESVYSDYSNVFIQPA